MDSRARDPKFYVVGGPVQPGRDCYLARAADAELYSRLSENEYCHVLGQRQTGKTSLAAATAWKLRKSGHLVALVDLTQASQEDPSENAGRWYYSIAYRIVRDLRIKADVQAWWAERGGLTNLQRMREFFQEVVLEYTDEPVTILLDRIEATLGEPIAQDLFSALRACYDARATDVAFQRLTFALFGSAAPNELVRDVQGSPFEISAAIPLPDFSAQEIAGLVNGLGDAPDDAELIVRRVWSWTRGHPYLSQKIFRALARRKDTELTVDTVDELVQTQFLSGKTISEEPHLSAIAERLLRPDKRRAARLNLYGRIRKGVEVMLDSSSEVQRELLTAGLVSVGEHDELRVRNEIYAMVFGTRWVNQNLPFGIKGLGLAAAVLIAIVLVPVWYTEFLPRPYTQALSSANEDFEVAADAYNGLRRIPGYAASADRLYENYLVRRARQADELREFRLISSRLTALPGGEDRAAELRAGFWERQAGIALDQGDRDVALVALLEALQIPTEKRRRWAGELIGADYRNLVDTWFTTDRLQAIRVYEEAGRVTLLDKANRVQVWNIDYERPRLDREFNLVAEEWLELNERLVVDAAGAQPVLYVETGHAQPQQVEVRLRAPSGETGVARLTDGTVVRAGLYAFPFARFAPLAGLRGEALAGNWGLALTDVQQGVSSELLGWGLSFDGGRYAPDPDYVAQPIPEPRATASAQSRLSTQGRLALSWPADEATRGALLVWDLDANDVVARIPRSLETLDAKFVLLGQRVITLDTRNLQVWDSATGEQVGTVPVTATTLPEVSANGRFAIIKTIRPDQTPAIIVWDLQRMRRVGEAIPAGDASLVAVDSAGSRVAVGGRDAFVRVWDVLSGALIGEFELGAAARMVKFDGSGQWLATDDLSSTFRLWNLASDEIVIERFGTSPWAADFSADSTRVLFGSSERAYELAQLPSGRVASVGLRHARRAKAIAGTVLLENRNLVVTTDSLRSVKLWSLPAPDLPAAISKERFPSGARAALNADGRRVAVGAANGGLALGAFGAPGWFYLDSAAAATGSAQHEVMSIAFAAGRELLASASIDGRVRLWNTADGSLSEVAVVHPDGGVYDLLFIDAGARLVSASRREVIVTNLESGAVESRLRIQANRPQLAYAAETGEIFVADDLNGVTSWQWREDVTQRLVDSDYRIRTVVVTPDGRRMITASDKRRLTVWDLTLQEPLEQTVRVASRVDDMWLTREGALLVQAGYWLQAAAIYPNGLAIRKTRLLPEAPAAVRPAARAGAAYVVYPPGRSRRLRFTEVDLSEPAAAPFAGEPAELRRYWQERLSLTLDDKGRAVPLVAEPLSLSSAEP